jgi:hypothetical protein
MLCETHCDPNFIRIYLIYALVFFFSPENWTDALKDTNRKQLYFLEILGLRL